jgi:hypothetical protein
MRKRRKKRKKKKKSRNLKRQERSERRSLVIEKHHLTAWRQVSLPRLRRC